MSQAGQYLFSRGVVETLTGNSGGPVGPTAGNIDTLGAGLITVAGNPVTSTLTWSIINSPVPGANQAELVMGRSDNQVATWGILESTNGTITITQPAPAAVNIVTGPSIATTYHTDLGDAVPALGILNVAGGLNINTAGAGNTVTINLNNNITVPGFITSTAGPITSSAQGININDSVNNAFQFALNFNKDRAGAIVHTADSLGHIFFNGFDGAVQHAAAEIQVFARGTPGAGKVAGEMQFLTAPDAVSVAIKRLTITSAGNLVIAIPDSGLGLEVQGGGATIDAGNFTVTAGDAIITAGNLDIPATASNLIGSIVQGGQRFIHSYGTNNIFIGEDAGNYTLTIANAKENVGIGSNVLSSLVGTLATNAQRNTAIGYNSQAATTEGSHNSSFGRNSLTLLTTGNNNSAFGSTTGSGLLTGSNNIMIGNSAGSAYAGAESNNIVIGHVGLITENATIRIGTNGTQTSCFIQGIAGVAVANEQPVVINTVTGQLGVGNFGGITWQVVGVNSVMAPNNGYLVNAGGAITLALPAVSAQFDMIEIVIISGGGSTFQITQAAGQAIGIGNNATTIGGAGSLTSRAQGDSIRMICTAANTVWQVLSSTGNFTVV